MAAIADSVTISIFIGLIVCAICFYLFTRIKQTEKKLALMEGILLDLKTATESNFLESPAQGAEEELTLMEQEADQFIPTLPEETVVEASESVEEMSRTIELSQDTLAPINELEETDGRTVQVNKLTDMDLEALSLAELQSLARSKNIANARKMRKSELIAAIKGSEEGAVLPSMSDESSLLASPL